MLVFPRFFVPDELVNIQLPSHPVNIFTSSQKVEWRSINSCVATHAELTLMFNSRTDCAKGCWQDGRDYDVLCEAMRLWNQTFSGALSFSIDDDHPLWDFMGPKATCYREQITFNNWRLKEQPDMNIQKKGIWQFSIKLIGNIPDYA